MKLRCDMPAIMVGLALSGVFFTGCTGNNTRETEKLMAHIKDSRLPAWQRSTVLAELGIKALQDTSDVKLMLNYANLLLSAGYASAGLKIYREMLNKKPDDSEIGDIVHNAELQCLMIPEDTIAFPLSVAQASYSIELNCIQLLDKQIGESPAEPGLYELRGNHLMVIGLENAGIWDLKKALNMDPCFPDALFSLAVLEMRNRKNQESMNTMVQLEHCMQEKDAALKPDWKDFTLFLRALMKKDSLIQQDPKITDYYMQKANIYSQVKEYDLAVATLSEALKISPENGEIFAFRAYIHYTMGNRESALLDLAQAERLTGKTDTELSRLIKEKK